ncbi:MAG: HAMP domain-containing protein, partial [Steroidobacteraceae bacterium]
MSSVSGSSHIEDTSAAAAQPAPESSPWRWPALWPRSLFGRLFISVLIAVFVAQAAAFTLIARERHRFVAEANVREWSRRIVDLTDALAALEPQARSLARTRLERIVPAARHGRRSRPPVPPFGPASPGNPPAPSPDFRKALAGELAYLLGPRYGVAVYPAGSAPERVISVSRQPPQGYELGGRRYDVKITLPDRDALHFQVAQGRRGPLLPRNLVLDMVLLAMATAIVLYAVARSITRPLSRLARAAEAVGRDVSQPPLG